MKRNEMDTICKHCGFGWGYHRSDDDLCQAAHKNGGVWRGAWEANGAPGTHFTEKKRVDNV